MSVIDQTIQLKLELDQLRPLSKEDEQRIMQKFRLDWNYHSNHLEGNSLTYGETKALILFGLTAQGKPLKDHFEITGHNEAIKWIEDVVKKKRPLTEQFIRELHKLLLKEPYEVDAITPDGKPTKRLIKVGQYKTEPNHVLTKTGEIFRFASPEETPAKMHDLMEWFKEQAMKEDTIPVLLAAEFHYRFIRIHPFDDGNGRTARILMNFILMQSGYPPVIIRTDDKENYFANLRLADAGQITPFIEHIASNLNHSLSLMIRGAKGEEIEDADDVDKEIALLKQKVDDIGDSYQQELLLSKLKQTAIDSIISCIKLFEEKSKLMSSLYEDSKMSIAIQDNKDKTYFYGYQSINRKTINAIQSAIDNGTKLIMVKFGYKKFKTQGLNFNYTSEISFTFDSNNYKLETKAGFQKEKDRKKVISKDEILKVIKQEILAHKQFVEEKLEKTDNH